MAELLPAVLDGAVKPGRVFDRTFTIDQTPAAYWAMDDREGGDAGGLIEI